MARQLGYHLPMGRKRGYHMHFQTAAVTLKHTIVDVDNGYAIAPMQRGLRLTTGAEFALRDAPATPEQLQRIEPVARGLSGDCFASLAMTFTEWGIASACGLAMTEHLAMTDLFATR
jgi:glycine/D-amino acid oxidase-like deaminating enzyme